MVKCLTCNIQWDWNCTAMNRWVEWDNNRLANCCSMKIDACNAELLWLGAITVDIIWCESSIGTAHCVYYCDCYRHYPFMFHNGQIHFLSQYLSKTLERMKNTAICFVNNIFIAFQNVVFLKNCISLTTTNKPMYSNRPINSCYVTRMYFMLQWLAIHQQSGCYFSLSRTRNLIF